MSQIILTDEQKQEALEKRIAHFRKDLNEIQNKHNIGIRAELQYAKAAIIPVITLFDKREEDGKK